MYTSREKNAMAPPVEPRNQIMLIVLIAAGIIITGLVLFIFLTQSGAPGPAEPDQSPGGGARVSPIVTTPVETAIPATRGEVVTPVVTAATALVATPVPRGTTLRPTLTGTPATFSSEGSEPAVAPEPFSFSVSPVTASAQPGDTLSYTLRIEGGQGQTEPIHFTLKASALFITQTFELGDEPPPFPKTVTYQFVVPGNVPTGITINGVITATGAGQTREQPITLIVK
jgi:hypothetical protein